MKTWINKVASGIFDGISENGSWRWVEAGVVQGCLRGRQTNPFAVSLKRTLSTAAHEPSGRISHMRKTVPWLRLSISLL